MLALTGVALLLSAISIIHPSTAKDFGRIGEATQVPQFRGRRRTDPPTCMSAGRGTIKNGA